MLTPHQNGGHNEKADLSSCTSSTVNLCLRGLVRSSHATDGFAITKPIGNPADRLHQCWCALHLGYGACATCGVYYGALPGDTHLAPGAGVISRSKAQLQPHLLRQQVPLVRHAFWFCCSAALPHPSP